MNVNRNDERTKQREIKKYKPKNSKYHLSTTEAWNNHLKKQATARHHANKVAKKARKAQR